MKKKGSWILFLIGIGLLFITLSPTVSNPLVMIIGGLLIVITGTIVLKIQKKSEKKEVRKEEKK